MRDPMSWAIPIFRAFGILVKVHILFPVVTLGLFFRQITLPNNAVWWPEVLMFTVVMLFAIITLHEFGHCFGGRAVGGEATEILIWPLGGLAYVDVPQTPRAHMIMIAAGPAVNLGLCILTGLMLVAGGYLPNANPIANPYVAEVKNYRDGRLYTSEYALRLYAPGSTEPLTDSAVSAGISVRSGQIQETREAVVRAGLDWAVAPTWVVWMQRAFWLNFVLLLFNLLPAYPLDGGQLLQGIIWDRSNYRQGVTIAAYSGYVMSVLFLIISISANEALLMGLGGYMLYCSSMKLHSLDAEEGVFGYDFSAGYTSLERDDPPKPRPKRGNFIKRWLSARAARRIQREIEQRQQDDERMDQLLDKIAKFGKDKLTDEERRFMERVSARYRNRS